MGELAIRYNNITINGKGLDYQNIIDINISQKVNDHGYAMIKVNMLKNAAASFLKSADESTAIEIVTTASNQKRKSLFYGYVEKVETMDDMHDETGSVVSVYVASMSKKLDIKKRYKTFQNDSKSYKDIMQAVADEEKATVKVTTIIEVKGTDYKINELDFYKDIKVKGKESWVIQYHQTAWEFILQMASRMGACVFTDITHDNGDNIVKITVGVPTGGKSFDESVWCYSNVGDVRANGYGASVEFETDTYGCVGDKVSAKFMKGDKNVGGGSYIITEISTSMKQAVMRTTMKMQEKNKIVQKLTYNENFAGHMLHAIVKEVNKDKVKVWFDEIDKSYDSSTTKEFVYSTTYASKEKSGFYCMPEVDDIVRIYLPSFMERDGFASSGINKTPLENPQNKMWRTPGNKEILLTQEGICIIAEKEKIYINLKNNDGIEITSTKPINISSEKNITLKAKNKVNIEGGKEVNLKVAKSSVKITNAAVVLGAKGIYIN